MNCGGSNDLESSKLNHGKETNLLIVWTALFNIVYLLKMFLNLPSIPWKTINFLCFLVP